MEEEGKKRVEITGMNDKRQITMVLGVSKNGRYLSPRVICAGKTNRCSNTLLGDSVGSNALLM